MQAVTSTMASVERKRASSTRRGGMTVLGKVAVPKPINLPSQKLENHGMDPNVEIVPKAGRGTLSWGSHSSSPASNAWGSSSLSLSTDNGHSSSGGSGTRPSTGGSEKANEFTTNAWGSNSRPSSASGSLTSNQASGTILRPHSADTRPGSSQLSRFAEPSNENSGVHSKIGSFSLASGDFPTLGSEKEDALKTHHSSPHGDNVVADVGINNDIINHGRRDSPPYEDGRQPNVEKWEGDALQRNPIMSAPTQHFASCHGAPVGSPSVGVWFRGPPGASPYAPPGGPSYGPPGAPPYGSSGITAYGPLIGPGGFPVEHPYYHPPIPAPSLGNSNGAGPRGLHQNNGEMYRPHMPDGHFRPRMLRKPGFFAGPVPYEGYHPTPMGYCGPDERDIPYLRPAGGPSVYDRHFGPNFPDLVNFKSASDGHGGHGSNEKPSDPEQVASGHRHNHHEQYNVLLTQQGDGHEWGDSLASNDSQIEKGHLHRTSRHEKDHSAGSYNNETILEFRPRRTPDRAGGLVACSHTKGHGGSQFHTRERLTVEGKSAKGVSSAEQNSQDKVSSSGVMVPPKNYTSLIKKTEGLNAKAGGTDGKQDAALDSIWDEGRGRPHMISKVPHSIFPASNVSVTHARNDDGGIINPPISNVGEAAAGPISSRKLSNSEPQIRTDFHSKGKSDFLKTEGRHKRPHIGQFSTVISSKSEPVSLEASDQRSIMGTGNPESSLEGKDIVSDTARMPDSIDIDAQKAKKREIAKLRAIQLQKEEEERIKEQKAKAQAKLEELNRRTKLMESSTGKGEMISEKSEMVSSSGGTDHKGEKAQPERPVSAVVALKSVPSSEINSIKPNYIYIGTRTLEPPLQIPKDDLQGSVMSSAEQEGGHNIDARAEPQHNGGKNHASKSKSKGYYKEKQNFELGKVASEQNVKASGDTVKHDSKTVDEVNKNMIVLVEPVVPQRTNSNKSGKNKHKVGDKSALVVIQSVAPNNADAIKDPSDSGKPRSPKMAEPTPTQPPDSSSNWTIPSELHASQLEETQSRIKINSQSRYQSSRKQIRNQQSNRTVDKSHGTDTVVWAPVRQPNKEVTEGSRTKVICEEAGDHIGNSDHVQSNLKNRRAEIERYVPKHVAKELAQHGSSQHPTPRTVDSMGSSATKVETFVENRIGDGNYSRKTQARAPGAWRQRVSVDSSHVQGLEDVSLVHSDVGKDIHIPQDHVIRPDHETREKKISSDGWNSPDDWNTNSYKALDACIPGSRDQGSINRGKRCYIKGNRNAGTYGHDLANEHGKDLTGKDMDIGHSYLTVSNNDEQDRTPIHKESRPIRGVGARQNFGGEASRFVKKEPVPPGEHIQPKDVKDTDGVLHQPFAHAKTTMGPLTKEGPQHDKRERKVAMPLAGAYSANLNFPAQVEQPPPVEHHYSSVTKKNVNQDDRNFRGQDSHGEWNSYEQDRRYHNQPSGRGRPKHNSSHYEYKPKTQYHSAGPDEGSSH